MKSARHVIIGTLIGLATIAVSVWLLSNDGENYESDAPEGKSTVLNQAYEGINYDITPLSFECDDYEAVSPDAEAPSLYGCILALNLVNTSDFELVINMDGDEAIMSDGEVISSSDELSRQYVPDNGLTERLLPEEGVSGGVFFEVPRGGEVESVNVYEVVGSEPIVVTL